MPIRLWVALVVSCVVPAVGECAAPFVEWSQGPVAVEMLDAAKKAVTSAGPEVDLGLMRRVEWKEKEKVRVGLSLSSQEAARSRFPCRFSFIIGWASENSDGVSYTREILTGSLALPIMDVGPRPPWLHLYAKMVKPGSSCGEGFPQRGHTLEDLKILHLPEVPFLSINSRRLKLHLDTVGVGRWDTALVELWLTRDGWTWHRYQHELLGDSLLVTLPEQGRYGLRVVVDDVDGPAPPTPRTGEAPQLWVEIEYVFEENGHTFFNTQERCSLCKKVYSFQKYDLPGEVNRAEEFAILHPRSRINRVETEKVWISNSPQYTF